MPVSTQPHTLAQYNSWAFYHKNEEAALSETGPGIGFASTKVGALARFFNTKAAQSVRSEVMADFTRALTDKYGVTLAQEALTAVGLTPTSKLDGKKITDAISYASMHREKEVTALLCSKDLKLTTTTLTRADILGPYVPDHAIEQERMRDYLRVRQEAVALLSETPLNEAELESFYARCSDLLEHRLVYYADKDPAPTEGKALALYEDSRALWTALVNKYEELSAMIDSQPLSDENVTHFKTIWSDGAQRALETLKNDYPELQDQIDEVLQHIKDTEDTFVASIPLEKDPQKAIAKDLFAQLKAKVPNLPFSEKALARQIFAGYCETLNRGDWSVIRKDVTATVGNVPVTLTSEIVPGSRIGAPTDDETGPIGETYEQGVKGYMCHSAHTDHAVNLAVSSISVNGSPDPAFRGIRHGVHCAWEVSGASKRAEANVHRAEEAVIAAFLADPANMAKVKDGKIDLNMVSVSLLTPDVARHIKWGRKSDERLMLREQTAAWKAVAEKGVTFTHDGQTITIKPKILTFNFGVNAGAVKWGNVAPNLAGGWGMSDDMNLRSYRELRPMVVEFLEDESIPEDKRRAVQTLFNQCMDTLRAGNQRSDKHDAYKVAARYAVIAHLMGMTPCWNCKSGKDRTGQMDVECKFLATLAAQGAPIPKPGAKLTAEQTALFRSIALESGNFEMQKYNTGLQGFKTSGVKSIVERLGGALFRMLHKGGADYVNV